MRLNCRWLGITCSRGRVIAALLLLVLMGASALELASKAFRPGANAQALATPASPLKAYAQLPMIFESNQGQTDPKVKFLAHGSGYGLFLTADSAVLSLQRPAKQNSVLSMALVNANPRPDASGTDQLPGKSNYFIGNDPAKWRRDIPQFAHVRYVNVYPGIDLVFYGNQRRLEYDFEVKPGSDPRRIGLRFEGAHAMSIDASGDLVLAISGGDVRLQAPRVYQRVGEEQRPVQGRFEIRARNEAGFALQEYDRSRTLVIDPILTYSTYLGGTGNEGCSVILGKGIPLSGCPAVAVDSASNAYIAGSTTSTNFPTVSPIQSTLNGTANIFISKFNAAASALLFSTYLGGDGIDYTAGVGVDQGFDVLVAGTTSSTNFPTKGTNTAFQATPVSTNDHVFVSELNPAGDTLQYSTYLSGNGVDTASGLAVDSEGNAYVTGTTTSTNPPSASFPATFYAIQTSSLATSQFFLTKVSPLLSGPASVPYSTYFGGRTPTNGQTLGGGVAVDPSLNVYITGGTNFSDLTMLNAFQTTLGATGAINVFVAKINPAATSGTQLLYSTYLGGSGDDIGYGIASDGTSAYVTGSTSSTNFPAAGSGVYQSTYGGGNSDAFLAKLANPVTTGTTPGQVTLTYSTYIGGSGTDVGLGVAVDSIQGARLTGWTNSPNIFVLNNSIQTGFAPTNDAFVARIDTTATSPTAPGHYFTYLGGSAAFTAGSSANTYGTGIAVDSQGASYVAGETDTVNLLSIAKPVNSPFQINLTGPTGAFLSKLGPFLALTLSTPTVTPATVGVGNQVTFAYTITNSGDATNSVTFTDSLPSAGASFTSATVSPGSCGTANSGIVQCFIGTLNAGATATASVVLTPTANTIPSTTPVVLGNSASVGVPGATVSTNFGSVTVNDFNISVSPATATVPAGVPAAYTATVTPTGNIPESVSLSCSSGLPTGATCSETTNPFPSVSGAVSTVLVINTTARVTTITDLRRSHIPLYAAWLPVSGLALLGVGIGGSRKRRLLMAVLLAGFFSLILFQPACGSSKQVTTTTGTPAGTYVVTVAATSGSATRNAVVTLVVQ